jgi:hypothetical protein
MGVTGSRPLDGTTLAVFFIEAAQPSAPPAVVDFVTDLAVLTLPEI